jgi:DNA-binding response OmpR family regulator
MKRILLIDDDESLLEVLTFALQDEGYEVLRALDGSAGFSALKKESPDLVISDVNMPGLDGFTLCRKVRESGIGLPFILLTSRDNDIDEALGLELGADDYVHKPFSNRVLLARIKSLLRREELRSGAPTEEEAMIRGSLHMHTERLEVSYAGTPVAVTVTEFRLLHALAHKPGRVFSRGQLLEKIRDDGSVVAERIIDTYVRRLRRKMQAIDAEFDAIDTVVGAGYRWQASKET